MKVQNELVYLSSHSFSITFKHSLSVFYFRLLLDEQKRIDVTLSTCKQLTCTLFTLKRYVCFKTSLYCIPLVTNIFPLLRLAAVQENGISVNIPTFRTIRDPRPEDKKLYLQQISKIIPNHEARMVGLAVCSTFIDGRHFVCSSNLATDEFHASLIAKQKLWWMIEASRC